MRWQYGSMGHNMMSNRCGVGVQMVNRIIAEANAEGKSRCPMCEGVGEVIKLVDFNSNETMSECPMCGGLGYVRNYKQEDA